MKRLILCALLLGMPSFAFAQEAVESTPEPDPIKTLIPSDDFTSGGFGAPVIKVGSVDGTTGVFAGGRGGWVINRTFVIGGGGYGWASGMSSLGAFERDTNVAFGYGGLELEYLIESDEVVHATVMTLVGAGGFTVFERFGSAGGNDWDNNRNLYSTATFVIEPAANVEVTILKWMRIGLGVGYRMVTGIDANINGRVYDNSTVSGFFGVGTLKFGVY